MNNFKRYSAGFVLIEIAIAMVVISLCMGSLLLVLRYVQKTQQERITLDHQHILMHALNAYHRKMGTLPCPSLPRQQDGFALKRCKGPKEQIGIIPYKTLGLPENITKDGYGHYFTYGISESSTVDYSNQNNSLDLKELILMDMQGRPYETNQIAYILISHGPKGNGAFSLKEERHRFPTASFFEAQNANDTLLFYVDIPFKESSHRVYFVQRSYLDTPTLPVHQSRTFEEDHPYHIKRSAVENEPD